MEAEATTVRSTELVGEAGAVAFSEGSWLGAFPVSGRTVRGDEFRVINLGR